MQFVISSNNGNFNGSTDTGFSIDLLTNGGLVFHGNTTNTKQLKVDLGGTSITGTVAIDHGGTGSTTASGAASALGVGTEDSPQFTGISLGSTAITESSGTVSIGGSVIRTGDISLGTDTTGNYVKTVSAGNGLDITGSTGEGSDHTLSLDLKANHGLIIDSTELKIDLKTSGGLEFDSGQMRVKLDDTGINGTLPVGKGGTGLSTGFTHGDILFVNTSGTFSKLAADSGKYLKSKGKAEDYLLSETCSFCNITIFRPSIVFGEGDGQLSPDLEDSEFSRESTSCTLPDNLITFSVDKNSYQLGDEIKISGQVIPKSSTNFADSSKFFVYITIPKAKSIFIVPSDDRTENKIRENIIKNNIIMKDGYIYVNNKPGLGIEVDETYLNEIKI